jgi:hypothetical protein
MGPDEKTILLAIFFLVLLIVLFLDGIHTNTLTKRKIEKKIKQEKDLLMKLSLDLNKFPYMQLRLQTMEEKKAIFKELLSIHKEMFKQHYAASEIISNKNLLFINEFDGNHVVLGNVQGLDVKSINNWLETGSDYELQIVFEQYRDYLLKRLSEANENLQTAYERL